MKEGGDTRVMEVNSGGGVDRRSDVEENLHKKKI